MRYGSARKEDQLRAGARFTLPALSSNKSLLMSRSLLQGNRVLKLDDEIIRSLGDDISQMPSVTHSTVRHLSSRHVEVSQWQARISESIGRVDQEIMAVEMVKDAAECCLQERQLYSQLMSDCVTLNKTLSTAVLAQDRVLTKLMKEERLTSETRDLLQKQICMLCDKLSSLKDIRAQLLADFQDKSEAIKLTAKCITQEDLSTQSSRLTAVQYKPNHVSYDKWLSRCRDLRLTADNLIKDSSTFRRNLRFTLANLKNAQQHQRHSTDDSLRRKINELSRIQDTMIWEKARIKDEISDLTKDIQKLMIQIRNCDSKLHQATRRLDILSQRPRFELCLDQPLMSLTLEQQDLIKMGDGLRPVLKQSQQDLELSRRRLMILDDKLIKNAHTLEVVKKCHNLHRSFLPALDTTVILANKPKFVTAVRRFSPQTHSRAQ